MVRKKGILFLAAVLAAVMLAGCGREGEKTKQGMSFLEERQFQEALTCMEEALSEGEDRKLALRGAGIAYMGLLRYEDAADAFLQSLAESRGIVEEVDYDLNLYLAAAYTKVDRDAEAEAVYDSVLALRENHIEALFLRGNTRLKRGNYSGAKEDFDRVVILDGKDFDRLISLYEVFEYYGYKDAGQGYLTDALQTYEKQMSDYDRGRMLYYLGDYQRASLALETAKDQGGANGYLYLGMSYEATGDYNYAASVYNSYLARDAGNAQIYNQLGLCNMKKGAYEEALSAFQTGMQIEGNPVQQSLQFNEIVAYEYLGEFQKAAVLMENYIKSYPDDAKAIREYGFLKTR